MATHLVMDRTGHTVHEFDKLDPAALAEAEKRFMELTGLGFTPAVRTGPGKSELVRGFDPTREETLFLPRVVGG